MDETLYALLQLGEYTEVGDVAYGSGMLAAYRILLADGLPWVRGELLDAEGHLLVLAVKAEDLCLDLVTYLQVILGDAEAWAPAHLAYVDETLYARLDLYECAVVGNEDNLTLNLVTYLEVRIEGIPRMLGELLEAQGDSLLGLVEVEYHDIDLLVEADNLLRMVDAAPAEVGDVDETVNTAQIDEYAVGSDVLDGTLKHLAFLELADDLALLSLELGLDEGLVGYYNIAELLVDLDDLEVHGGIDELVVVAYRLDVDL